VPLGDTNQVVATSAGLNVLVACMATSGPPGWDLQQNGGSVSTTSDTTSTDPVSVGLAVTPQSKLQAQATGFVVTDGASVQPLDTTWHETKTIGTSDGVVQVSLAARATNSTFSRFDLHVESSEVSGDQNCHVWGMITPSQ
jgi:hypothetical protein